MTIIDSDLLSIQEARILAENAAEAQKQLATFPQEKLDSIVACVADAVKPHVQNLATLSSDETGYGRWQDKCIKSRFVLDTSLERLKGMRCVGVIGESPEERLMDVGVPMGVIAALCPSTSPVSTTLYKTLIAIKSGNAILFSPHPRARKTMGKLLDIMIEAAENAGLPQGCLGYLHTVAKGGTQELMEHGAISLIMNTGVPAMLQAAYAAGKPVIYGGTGNGPAFIERSADISQAVSDIISSKGFDNGAVASAEQSVVVDGCIANEVKKEMARQGAYFMSEEESLALARMLFLSGGKLNAQVVGASAQEIAQMAGIQAPSGVKLLVAERRYVSESDPYCREMLCPVLTFYVEEDWMHACEKCIELLLSERNGHTLSIHSKDEEVIRQFALKKPVGRVLVNTPATFGGMGATTHLFPSMTLGSGSAGEGITADNVSPLNLIYTRKVGYGVRDASFLGRETTPVSEECRTSSSDDLEALRRMLKQAIKAIE